MGRADPDPADLATPLTGPADLDPLLERIGDARWVLLGEASHGTAEYYRWRAALTRRLVAEHGFSFIAVEGDWPPCAEVDAWVRGLDGDDDRDAEAVLAAFERWPTWMWANAEVADLLTWLRARNDGLPPDRRVSFHGIDVYSLWESIAAVVDYLAEHEPEAVDAAVQASRCFEPYREDPQAYAWATRMVPASCEDAVVTMLTRLREEAASPPRDGAEARFAAEQNAAVARSAERYYRAMVRGGPESWNIRDVHMVDTLDRLVAHRGPGARGIVWAHNTHIGDARATDMAADGLVNVGQLVRERHAEEGVVAVGFAGHRGEVIAGGSWGAPMERMPVPPARGGSLEDLLHERVGRDALLVLPPEPPASGWSAEVRDHRAIGVVYDPARERWGNYVPTVPAERYDALLWFEATTALHPLGPEAPADPDVADTFPSGV